VDRALKEMEERIYKMMQERVNEQREESFQLEKKVEHSINSIDRKIQDIKANSSHNSFAKERQKVVEATSS
jgi:hypothetical protein